MEPEAVRAHRTLTAIVLPGALTLALGSIAVQPDVDTVMELVGERVAEFYNRVNNVVCIETSRVQPVDVNSSRAGFVRTVESELRVEAHGGQASDEAAIVRTIRKVNGRVPRDKDQKDREGCTDPSPLSSEPLSFLLPAHRSEYKFRTAGMAKDRNRTALMIDFASVDRRSDAELIADPSGHDDCFDWSGHIASRGRIWVDVRSYDVIRVERGLGGPVDVKVPALIQRRYQLGSWVVIVRDDTTIRYRTIAFSNPDEVLLLPESVESLTVVQGGLQSTRRTQTFADYKRFLTGGRMLH